MTDDARQRAEEANTRAAYFLGRMQELERLLRAEELAHSKTISRMNEEKADAVAQAFTERDAEIDRMTHTLEDMVHMTCEAHPWLEWPHEDCPGPGMPVSASLQVLKEQAEEIAALTDMLKEQEKITLSWQRGVAQQAEEIARLKAEYSAMLERYESQAAEQTAQIHEDYAEIARLDDMLTKVAATRDEYISRLVTVAGENLRLWAALCDAPDMTCESPEAQAWRMKHEL